MKRSIVRNVIAGVVTTAAWLACGCSSDTGTGEESLAQQQLAARKSRCGNGVCNHREDCSTCPEDCGVCGSGGSGGGTGGSSSGGSGGSTGGSGGSSSGGSGGSSSGGSGGSSTGGSGGTGGGSSVCGSSASPPAQYDHVVVFSFENRTWSSVGLGFSPSTMPYLHSLASQCSFFSDWTETNTHQNSLTQYIGVTSGVDNPATVNDCNPSSSCRSTDDNIFRQVRVTGGTARNYVEGATSGCSASGNAAKHVPALYYYGTYTDATGTHSDHDFCNTEVRPYSEFDVDNLPTFAFVSPTQCNDGHDCNDATVDAWASANIQPVIDSAAYQAGTVAVFAWYDEDHPVPNAQIALTSNGGDITQTGIGSHAALLKTIEDMLGLPVMNQGQLPSAANLRPYTGL